MPICAYMNIATYICIRIKGVFKGGFRDSPPPPKFSDYFKVKEKRYNEKEKNEKGWGGGVGKLINC